LGIELDWWDEIRSRILTAEWGVLDEKKEKSGMDSL